MQIKIVLNVRTTTQTLKEGVNKTAITKEGEDFQLWFLKLNSLLTAFKDQAHFLLLVVVWYDAFGGIIFVLARSGYISSTGNIRTLNSGLERQWILIVQEIRKWNNSGITLTGKFFIHRILIDKTWFFNLKSSSS